MSTIVVTGGVGFIGYHVTRALAARGDAVVILDDFSDAPYPAADKRRNAAHLLAEFPGGVRVIEGTVTSRSTVDAALAGADSVVHLAGLAGVRPSFADPARYVAVNVEGSVNVLEAACARGIQRLTAASSSSVYGNDTPLPASEDSPCVEPASPYAATKRAMELLAQACCLRVPSLTFNALRFFTVYGPRQRPEMAITKFSRALLAGEALPIFGDGSMRRDFTHVRDIVRGVLAVERRETPGFRAFNLGSGAPVTLQELVHALAAACGESPVLVHEAQPLGDVDATFADIARARAELAWAPEVPLVEGLATVFAWLRAGEG
ncbi:MAG TPA: NAD-dependent epimerase/dehydratase family protein [Polyangiaceae bacterium]|nr:NAD-dependent epimerase/dehydratase family protein [Polyangiaceae bacterium]